VSVSSPLPSNAPLHVKPLLRGWLHVIGVVVLLGSSPILFARATSLAQVLWILCYVAGVGAMMVTSALYHRVQWTPTHRRAWQRADHSTIFAAITGTYLAIVGLTMHGDIRLAVMIIIGSSAAIGIAVRQFAIDAPKWANTLPYLLVSWAAVTVMPQIYRGGGPLCFYLIIGGGLAYSLGAAVYGTKWPRLSPQVFGYHELFHALTLVGAGMHFAAISVALH
jgi:hemolysin III